jgi:hypothetical protein
MHHVDIFLGIIHQQNTCGVVEKKVQVVICVNEHRGGGIRKACICYNFS